MPVGLSEVLRARLLSLGMIPSTHQQTFSAKLIRIFDIAFSAWRKSRLTLTRVGSPALAATHPSLLWSGPQGTPCLLIFHSCVRFLFTPWTSVEWSPRALVQLFSCRCSHSINWRAEAVLCCGLLGQPFDCMHALGSFLDLYYCSGSTNWFVSLLRVNPVIWMLARGQPRERYACNGSKYLYASSLHNALIYMVALGQLIYLYHCFGSTLLYWMLALGPNLVCMLARGSTPWFVCLLEVNSIICMVSLDQLLDLHFYSELIPWCVCLLWVSSLICMLAVGDLIDRLLANL